MTSRKGFGVSGRMEHRAGAAGGIEEDDRTRRNLRPGASIVKGGGVCQFFSSIFWGGANVDARGFVLELAEIQASGSSSSSDGSGADASGCRTTVVGAIGRQTTLWSGQWDIWCSGEQ